MNKELGSKAVEILQALLDGKTVQVRARSETDWEDYIDSDLHYPGVFSAYQEWRVKPVSRRFWVKVLEDGIPTIHGSRIAAECAFRGRTAEMFEVVEVL